MASTFYDGYRCVDCSHLQDDPEVPGICFCDLKDECWFQEAEE